jgi:hypothetical protein
VGVKNRRAILCILLVFFVMPAFGESAAPFKIRRIGKAPNFITLSPDGSKIYATSYASDELIVIDLKQKMIECQHRCFAIGVGYCG